MKARQLQIKPTRQSLPDNNKNSGGTLMKNLITKKSLVIAAALSLAFMMTSCSKKTAANKSNALYTLTFARGASGHALNPLFELGKRYYSEYGVDVKVVPLEREQIFESESIGKVDGAYNDLAFPLQFGGNGGNIVIYGGAMNGGMALLANPKVAAENPDIKNPANWKGLSITVQPFSIGELISKSTLRNTYNLIPDVDVKYKIIQGQPEELAAVQKGNADIVIIGPDFVETGKNMGLTYLFPLVALEDNYVCCRQTANADKFNAEKDAFQRLLKAHIRAYKDYKTGDKQALVKEMSKTSGVEEDWIYDYLYDLDKTQGRTHNPDPNYNGSLAVYETLEIDRPLQEYFNIDVYAKALTEIIEEFPSDNFYKEMWDFFITHNNKYPNFNYS